MADTDPLTLAMTPPSDETPKQRDARLRQEAEAKAISDHIDEQISREKEDIARRQKAGDVRVLLLGQSESGKTTTIKNFQIIYSPNSWRAERIQWRAVIYLNLVRSIRRILAALDDYHVSAGGASLPFVNSDVLVGEAEPLEANSPTSDKFSGTPRPSLAVEDRDPLSAYYVGTSSRSVEHSINAELLPRNLLELSMRLSPLSRIEFILISALSSGDPVNDNFEATRLQALNLDNDAPAPSKPKGELSISANIWVKALKSKVSKGLYSTGSRDDDDILTKEDIVGTLRACREDMISLWNDPYVKLVLAKRRYRPQDSSGFFLDDIVRLTEKDYVPTDQDVLNARIKTVGVIQHCFQLDAKSERGVNWTLYDVGGARNQRHVWASFFDNVEAIIFLAPISAFNQVLSEDTSVNRIADSLLLFKSICSNKLLRKVSIVLFLNKVDILKAKLESGIRFNEFITSYGDRPNTLEGVCQYFKVKFAAVFKEYTRIERAERELYTHFTAVNDPEATKGIIQNVRNTILRKSLQDSSLL